LGIENSQYLLQRAVSDKCATPTAQLILQFATLEEMAFVVNRKPLLMCPLQLPLYCYFHTVQHYAFLMVFSLCVAS